MIMTLALIAFLFKAYWWFASRHYTWADANWYFLLGSFSLLNIIEFLGNDLFISRASPMFFIQSYFAIGMFSFGAIYGFIKNSRSTFQNSVLALMLIGASILSAALFFSNHLLNGYAPDVYPLRSTKGNYFYLVYAFSFASMVAIFSTIISNYRRIEDALSKIRYASLFLAFTPFLCVVAWSSGSYILGIDANTGGMVPIATSVFLAIVIRTKCKSPYLIKSDPRKHIPLSEESKYYDHIEHMATQFAIQKLEPNQTVDMFECELIRYRLITQTDALSGTDSRLTKRAFAKSMGWSRPTLDRKLEKYYLNHYFDLSS